MRVEVSDTLRAEVKKIIPDSAKVGDMFQLSTGEHIKIMEISDSGKFRFALFDKDEIEKKVKKELEVQKLPSNTLTTSNINLSTSGTSGANITVPNNPDIKVSVNAKTKKGKTKDPDPFNWYIKKRLKY
jgi:hypothetical protein